MHQGVQLNRCHARDAWVELRQAVSRMRAVAVCPMGSSDGQAEHCTQCLTCSCTRLALSRPTTSSPCSSTTDGGMPTLVPAAPGPAAAAAAAAAAASVGGGRARTYRQLTHGCCLGRQARAALMSCLEGGRVPWQAQLLGACQQPSWRYHCAMTAPAGEAAQHSRPQHRRQDVGQLLQLQPTYLAVAGLNLVKTSAKGCADDASSVRVQMGTFNAGRSAATTQGLTPWGQAYLA